MPVTAWLIIFAAYVVGAIPFGLILVRLVKGIDIREHGSGNIGATNVYRVTGTPLGAAVWCLDVGKGLWPPLVMSALGLSSWWQVAAGLAAIVGHNASPFLGFKGGKGVATSLGVLLGAAWKIGVTGFVLWVALVLATGIVSIGSLAAIFALVPLALLFYPGNHAILTLTAVAAAYSLVKHRGNIQRLLTGTEPGFRMNRATAVDDSAMGRDHNSNRLPELLPEVVDRAIQGQRPPCPICGAPVVFHGPGSGNPGVRCGQGHEIAHPDYRPYSE